jgi:hypothetical protein
MATNRRQFMQDAARGVATGAIAAVAWLLVSRDRTVRSEAPCINRGACRGCSLADDCSLPAALSMRQVTTKGRS